MISSGDTPEPPGLLAALADDAGLFPPESLPMADALARHRADEDAGHPMLSGRFLCPGSRLGELRTEWSRLAVDPSEPLRLGVILDAGLDGLDAARSEITQDAVSGRALSAARLLFRAYGSSSTSEPREEAAALGLIP